MQKITEYLRDKYGPWGWMGQRAHDAAGIERILPLDFIVSCDHGADIPYYFREEDVFSVEKRHKVRKDWSNEDLNASLKGALGREVFERWNGYGGRVNLLCYRSVRKLENDVRFLSRKPLIYAMPERMKRRFDNKVLLYRNLGKLSLPRIPGRVERPGKITFNALRRELSLPFVIQFAYGSSGHFTFIIREEKEYNKLRRDYPDLPAVMRKYIDGFSLNVNAAVVSSEKGPVIVCTFPSVQIAGIPECSNFPSAFCGNDYAAAGSVDRKTIGQVEKHISVIGKWMAGEGYRGIFGMDFVVDKGTVYPVEINPRFQNSTSLYTVLRGMLRSPENTLFLLHIAEFLQAGDKVIRRYVREFPYRDLMDPLNGCQIIVHNRMRKNMVTGGLIPGVYRMEEGGPELIREGASLDLCQRPGDFLVTCGVPEQYSVIEPNAPICKIQMRESVMDPVSKRKLTGEAREIVAGVYRKLALKDASLIVVGES